jgi:hypothetical protein
MPFKPFSDRTKQYKKTGWNWNQELYFTIDWWIYLFRKEVRSKRYCNTDKLLVAGIAKPQSFDIYRLQMMYVDFSGSSSFYILEDKINL